MVEKVKAHIIRHKQIYLVGSYVVIAGITYVIMRDVMSSKFISRGISVTAERGISVLGKRVEMHNVSYILSNRQGPPSWVVRCKETGNIFTSQESAALDMGLSPAELSKHLNGVMEHVRGYHFERICLAA